MMNTKKVDVEINITAHGERYYLHRTLRSLDNIRENAATSGISTRLNIILDKADSITTRIAEDYAASSDNVIIHKGVFGDPAESRNFLISKTNSKYILFVDGDDLFTENFASEAYRMAEEYGKPCVVSAEDIVKFGSSVDPIVFRVESTVDTPGIKSAEFEMNLYVSQNLVSTEIYKQIPYEANEGNYGFEDWHWNTKVIASGYEFLVAPDTVFFYRQKSDDESLLRQHTTSNTVLKASTLFTPERFIQLPHDPYVPKHGKENEHKTRENPTKVAVRNTVIKANLHNSIVYRGLRKTYRQTRRVLKNSKSRHSLVSIEQEPDTQPYVMSERKRQLWRKMNNNEPLIRDSPDVLNNLILVRYRKQHSLATTYYNFCKEYGECHFTDVIFVPWINRGGADLAMIDIAKVLSKAGRRVLIITTTGLESQWADRIKSIPNVTFIQSHDPMFCHLDHYGIKLFFLRFVQNWSIKTMTVMNSSIGFELIGRFGPAIRGTGCRIIVHNYAFPASDGQFIDAFPSLTMGMQNIDEIIVDSLFHKNEFIDIYGYPAEQITEAYLTIDERIKEKRNGTTRKVLFANRIAREKQPDAAIETFKLLARNKISMDIYGALDEGYANEINFLESIEDTPNVEYLGTYEGSQTLDFSQYDICFMPSLYEGTPRIVLDSVKAGLYIVCTDVGGMPEVVSSKYSGKVVPLGAGIESFARAIREYYKDTSLHDIEKRRKANNKVLSLHTPTHYEKTIKTVYHVNDKIGVDDE